MKKIIYWIMLYSFSVFTLFTAPAQVSAQQKQAKKKTIAVLDMEAKGGLSKNETATLTDRLRSELVNIDKFIVVERGRMNDILQEQGFNLTGCTSSECAVEAGKLLGVEQMLTGAVGKIGNVLTVDIRIFDVTSGKIVKAMQYDHQGDVAGLLSLMKSVANQLVSGEAACSKQEKGGFPWLWISAGVVVVAGAAALLLGGSGDSGGGGESSSLPQPDWPPQ